MAGSSGKLPNPLRIVDHDCELVLGKVFIVYAHNPHLYTQLQPPSPEDVKRLDPTKTEQAIWEEFRQECIDHERKMAEVIAHHEEEVAKFAAFLQKSGVAVAYDRLLDDTSAANKLRWTQEQIADSDYVVLVITPSFLHFLQQQPPPEEEYIFSGDYLFNIIHGTDITFLPIFLNRPKELSLLPKAREANSLYEVRFPLDLTDSSRGDDLMSLYRLLTKQPEYIQYPVSQEIVRLKPKKRFGAGVVNPGALSEEQKRVYDRLCATPQQTLSDTAVCTLAQNVQFHSVWKGLAEKLGFTPAEVERLGGREGESEACFRMLRQLRDSGRHDAQVTALSKAILQLRQSTLLLVLNAACCD